MARMNISVPEEMRTTIVEIGDRVNWSALAQDAFRRAINEHKFPKEPKMEDVIERLRASKQDFLAREIGRGKADGREWAMKEAEFTDLVNLQRRDPPNGWTLDGLLEALNADRDFVEQLFGEDEEVSDNRAAAFVEGALEVYQEVANKL